MKTLCLRSLVAAALLLAAYGCAQTARVPVLRPAEINLSGTRKIAVGHFDGRGGNEIADRLSAQLVAGGYFEVMNRDSVGRLLNEKNLNLLGLLSAINPESASGFRKALNVDIIATGRVKTYDYSQSVVEGQAKDKAGKDVTTFTKKGSATVTVDFKIMNLASGEVLASKTFTQTSTGETTSQGSRPPDPDRNALLGRSSNAVVTAFVKRIAPYWDSVTVTFAKNEAKIPEIENGINFAKAGQWDNAQEQFQAATLKHPADQAAWYNLGLAYEYTYQFDKAEDALKKAGAIKPCKPCIKEISNVRRLAADRKRLEEQGVK